VCSDEASVFCYGHERGRLGKQLAARLDGYPQLALPVRTIKYLGIYRQKALLSALASRDRPRVRRAVEVVDVDYPHPSVFQQPKMVVSSAHV
jgi:hypothetical protein